MNPMATIQRKWILWSWGLIKSRHRRHRNKKEGKSNAKYVIVIGIYWVVHNLQGLHAYAVLGWVYL